ncbi:LacI family DNA-binding transcriptional regulator [Geminisphaera colitermitum]|uniref:LacI family DNA-binding transcriptional regulator n=1 Tax=Geminisphaera colitermitum TaxID=1148786 RepID=UPI0005BA65CE|nr:LacI family DNA-binding transcriptional regulator [Geminisphaera colitermitum]
MTVRELAAALDMSKTTVADALRNHSRVSAATREEVRRRAAELGYKPNPVAAAFLQQVRSKGSQRYKATLAFLYHVRPPERKSWYTQWLFYQGAVRRAKELGYALELFSMSDPKVTPRRLSNILTARGILGVIVGPHEKHAWRAELDWSRFAVVGVALSARRPAMCRVSHNHGHGVQLALRMCRRKGLRRIGLALQKGMDMRVNFGWSGAYLAMQRLRAEQHQLEPLLIEESRWNADNVRAWLEREQPEAVLTITERWPEKLRGWTNKNGQVPLLVGLDLGPDEDECGIDQQHERCGVLAVDALSAQILHNERGLPDIATTVFAEGVWREAGGGN